MRILVVEDSRRLAGIIKRGLLEEGYAVDSAYDGEEAQYLAETTPFDLIVLDIMLPKKDGLAVCRDLRAKGVNTPILMLTAKDSVEDKVTGLDTGADDYVVKPFNPQELMARVRSLLNLRSLHDRRVTEEKLGALGQMAEGVAHEVRNPMVTIGGFARRIRDRLPEDDPLREYAQHIIKEVERLETMVEEIVRFKALMIAPYEPVDLAGVVDQALAERARPIEEGRVRVVREFDPGLSPIQGDRGNLLLAVGNVIENALEAMEPGGTLTVSLAPEGERVAARFTDTGCGIAKSELPNVFDPFYTSKMTGAGMGLTMVHRIVTRHGGDVDIASQPGAGTTVALHLPVRQAKPI